MNDEEIEEKLRDAHQKEADDNNVEIFNFGWGQTEYGICSKTSNGYLTSEIDQNTLEIENTWEDYA